MKEKNISVIKSGRNLIVKNVYPISLDQTLDCGQSFRWEKSGDNIWHGIAFEKSLSVMQNGDELVFFNTAESDFNNIWRDYFDLDRNYEKIIKSISRNRVLKNAVKVAGGIRILRQEPWETLCSFIISQNNNIPRIKGIISRLCENFGKTIDGGYTFPSAEDLKGISVDDLAPLRSGFRAKYIVDAVNKVTANEVDFDKLYTCDIDEARAELMKIKGVGLKVADCTLLFSFGRIEAFPKDVWIKRAMEVLFDGELPKEAVPYAGIVQQYIFHYARLTKLQI